MKTSYCLADDRSQTFDDCCSPEWAVAYPYWEERNRLSWLFNTPYEDVISATPLVYGRESVCAGDWCAKLDV